MPQSAPIQLTDAAPPLGKRSMYIPSLDGIRAVSFLLVFVAHAGLEDKIPGGLGVTIFFFLSGYLITTLLRTEADQNGRISIRDFYIRRALRIFPPFYLTIFLGVLLHWTHLLGVRPPAGPISGEGVFFQSAHLANYWTIHRQVRNMSLDGIPLGSNVLWSLAVEEHFYLLFPLLYVILRKSFSARGQTALLALLCGLMLLWRYVLVYHFHVVWTDSEGVVQNTRTFFATDTRADSILWGCIFAIACNPMLDRRRILGLKLLVLVVAAIALMGFTFRYRDPAFRETLRYTLQGLILFPLFTAAIVYHESPLFRWLNWKVVKQLGVLSYSLYLVHFTVIYLVKEHLNFEKLHAQPNLEMVVRGLVAFALSLAVSSAIYRWVERPCAQLRKRFSHASGGKGGAVEKAGIIMPLRTAS